MTTEAEALEARWRRLEHALAETSRAVNSVDPHECPDAVARTLNALYDLWEFWAYHATPLRKGKVDAQDRAVGGDGDGETAAALVYARGSLTHVRTEFGAFTDTVSANVSSHVGCWRWQPHSDARYPTRGAWYTGWVAGREVLPPLQDALRWLNARPELARQ